MLMRRWERARQGDGQLVLIVGEPGLGKSRLIDELRTRLGETPHTWIEWSCSQLLQNTALHPLADWGRQRYGSADLSAEQRLPDLENSLARSNLTQQRMLRCWLRCSRFHSRRTASRPFRRRSCDAANCWR
jgi:predicted ATPase